MPIFADGFESGGLGAWTTTSGLVVESATVNAGGYAAEGSSATGVTFAKKTLPGGPYPDAYARVAFQVSSQAGQTTLLRMRDSVTGSVGYVYLSSTGRLGFSGGNDGTVTAASTVTLLSGVVPAPGWHALELHLMPAGSSSLVEVWLDGAPVAALTGTVDLGISGPVTVLQVGDTSASLYGWDVLYDDAAFSTSRLGPSGDVVAPTAPTNVAATSPSPFEIDLTWTASTDDVGVVAYDVYRDGALLQSLGAVTAFNDTTVLAGSTHTYVVQARDASGNVSTPGTATGTTNAAALPIFADGFESGGLGAWTTTSGLVVESANVNTGGYAAEGSSASGVTFAKKTLPGGPYPDAYARVAFQVTSQAGQTTLLRMRDSATGSVGFVYLSSTGKLTFTGGNDGLGASTVSLSSGVVPAPGWHALELHLMPAGSSSLVEVWLDGAPVAALTGRVDLGTSGPVTVLQVGDTATSTTGGWDVVYDDAAFSTSRLGPSGDVVAPTAPTNVAATSPSPFEVDLTWTASTDAVGVVGYDVYRDGALLQSLGVVTAFNDTTVLAGTTHTYVVQARDASGNVSTPGTATGTTNAAALPIFADGFESGGLGAWTTTSGLVVESANVNTGGYAAEGNSASGVTYAKKTLPGGPYPDAYARVAFQVTSQAAQTTLLRMRDTATGSVGFVYLSSTGKLTFTGGAGGTSSTGSTVTLTSTLVPTPGWHALELHLMPAGSSSLVEVWLDGAPVAALTGTVDLGTSGPVTVLQIGDTATSTTGWDVLYDDAAFSTSRLGPSGDVVAPTAPANVAATSPSPFEVDLTWTASTDAVGVVGYDVYRDGALLATLGVVTAFNDTTVQGGTTHTYAVRARDASGNESAPGTATGTTPAAATPVFADGFESGTFAAWTTPVSLVVESSSVLNGGFAAEGNSATGKTSALTTLPGTYSDAYARVSFLVKSQVAPLMTLLRLRDSVTGSVGFVTLTSGGRLGFTGGAGGTGTGGSTVTLSSTLAIGPGWHTVELHLAPAGASSTVQVWLDGAPVPALSGTVDLGSAGPVTVLQIGDNAASTKGWDVVYDDAMFSTSRMGI